MTGSLAIFALMLAGWSLLKAVQVLRAHIEPGDDIDTAFGRMRPEDIAAFHQHGINFALGVGLASIIAAAGTHW